MSRLRIVCKGTLATWSVQGYGRVVRAVPLSPTVGARLVDVDVTRPLPEASQAEVRQLFLDRHLLLVRGQALTPDDHDRFVGYFGPLQAHRSGDAAGYVTTQTDHPRSLFPELRPL